ncbi:MAG: SMC-Scp complex subunit ScpB [Gemmataceae bacterium]
MNRDTLQSRTQYSTATRRPMAVRPGNAFRPTLHRMPFETSDSDTNDPLGRDVSVAKVEAVLMLADEPITSKRLAEATGLRDGNEARRQIDRLRELYKAEDSPFEIADIAGGFLLMTRPIYHPWLLRLRRTGHDLRLTPAALETLAIVAYKQPVMRAEIEAVRGVHCVEMLSLLSEKGLIRIVGRHHSLGRPQLFGTTKKFLQAFGLQSLDELPEIDRLKPPSATESKK